MTAEEIKKIYRIYTRILDLVKRALVSNNSCPDGDPLWVMCRKCDYYTDGSIILDSNAIDDGEIYEGILYDCAAEYAKLCMDAGADENDFYLGI